MGNTPCTLRCSKCKRGEDWRRNNRPSGIGLKRTGRARGPVLAWNHGWATHLQVIHEKCGHKMWTTHGQARYLPLSTDPQ